jgi:Skp family chaperone for outer membrane proteins
MSYPEHPSDPYSQPAPPAPVEPAPSTQFPSTQMPAPTPQMPAPTAQIPAPAAPVDPAAPAAPAYGAAYQPGQAPVSPPAYPVASGLPYPTSSMPATGAPYAAYPAGPAAPAAKPGRLAVILLSVLSGLLVLALIGMTTLFFVNAGNAKKKQDSLTAQLADRDKELADTKSQLQAKVADLSKLQQDLDGSKAATAEQTKEKEAVAKCLNLIYSALGARTASEFSKKMKAAEKPCDEADKYVDNF